MALVLFSSSDEMIGDVIDLSLLENNAKGKCFFKFRVLF
jgi:hypothetical protein